MTVSERIEAYCANVWMEVEGWIGRDGLAALQTGIEYQEGLNIQGDALEIGVYQGRFFLALCAALRSGDTAVALDIFDQQSLNVDNSGRDVDLLAKFSSNLQRFTPPGVRTEILAGDSMALRTADILGRSPADGYRLISVDGGHTAEHVMNDLALVSDILVNGALVILDDWMSPHWPGVHEGYVRFMMHANRRLAPAFYTENKLFMTTISHQAALSAYYAAHYPHLYKQTFRKCDRGHSSFFRRFSSIVRSPARQ